jgi:hypothetical protein
MHLIVFAGLASFEKAHLVAEVAESLAADGSDVVIIDNSDRHWPAATQDFDTIRMTGPLSAGMFEAIARVDAEYVLLIVAESTTPDALIDAVEMIRDHRISVYVRLLALVDDRTCDCFPALREQLEANADVTLRSPYRLEEALKAL